ncbi:hypothetical protein MCEMSEM18_03667 [Comamonadaceae bacterium]
MKNTTFKRSIHSALIAAALGLSVAAHAQTEAVPALSSASSVVAQAVPAVVAPAPVVALKDVHIKDVKVGMVVEGPITLPGMFSVPLPIPPGKWEVLQRFDEMKGFGYRKIPFVNLIMGNTDPKAQNKAFTVRFNVEKASIAPAETVCPTSVVVDEKNVHIVNNFGTASNMNDQRCALAKRFPDLSHFNKWSLAFGNFGYYLIQPQYFPEQPPVLFWGIGSLLGARIARWSFYFEEASPAEPYSETDPRVVAMKKQVEVYGEQMRRFANNEKDAEFPAEYFPTK